MSDSNDIPDLAEAAPEPPIRDGIALRVCRGPRCGLTSAPLFEAAQRAVERRGLSGVVCVVSECCFAHCPLGPNVLVERWRDGLRDERAIAAVLSGAPEGTADGGACLVHHTTVADIEPMIEHFVRRWRID